MFFPLPPQASLLFPLTACLQNTRLQQSQFIKDPKLSCPVVSSFLGKGFSPPPLEARGVHEPCISQEEQFWWVLHSLLPPPAREPREGKDGEGQKLEEVMVAEKTQTLKM